MITNLKIAVASGKGGTGKTTVSTALACALSKAQPVTLIDCDVEEPNSHLLLGAQFDTEYKAYVPSISVDNSKCIGCGKCAEVCRFNSIACLGKNKGMLFFPELCHSCMGCVIACPVDAITESTKSPGLIRTAQIQNINLISGLLNIGQAMSTGLIESIKSLSETAITIFDSPPGTSCSMLATVRECDYTILVTEPTPFGLNDLNLAVRALKNQNLNFGVVINRSTNQSEIIDDYCKKENIEILTKIDDSISVAKLYSKGSQPYFNDEDFAKSIDNILQKITTIGVA